LERLYWSDIPIVLQRCLLALAALTLLAMSLFFATRYREAVKEAEAAKAREASYEQALHPYVARFKRGTTRGEIEGYLREQGVKFSHSCCMGVSHDAWDTLIKVGEEEPIRFCSEQYVFIGFEFVSKRARKVWDAQDTDTLTVVRLYKEHSGCL
jgi:hypothetical protein